ncbi:MFS transporter [uncultured Sphingomonas sp.]|uniref:MFS transporter n=1 Tax=uncultured Sphingomonas sp. TaxID=158754 RepID=UPI0035C9EE1D
MWLVVVLVLAWVLGNLDRNIMALLVPSLKASFGITDVQVSLLQGLAFSLFFLLAGYPIGRLADRLNRRNIIAFGVAGWSLMTVLSGFASSYGWLFATRTLVGVGEACLLPASVSIVADCFPQRLHGRVMGLLLAGGSLGIAASTGLGGILLDGFEQARPAPLQSFAPWQLTYIAVGLPGFIVAALVLTAREPTRRGAAAPASVQPDNIGRVLAGRRAIVACLLGAFGLNLLAAYGSGAWLATMMMREYDMRASHVGISLGLMHLLIGGLGPVLGGWISDSMARTRRDRGRLHFVMLAFAAQILVGLTLASLTAFAPTLFAYAACILLTTFLATSALAVLPESVPTTARGRTMAMYQVVASVIGSGLGPLCIALITDHVFGDEKMVRQAIAVVLVATSLIGLALARVAAVRQSAVYAQGCNDLSQD